MGAAIQIENLSKIYRLGEIGTGTVSQDLNRWFARIKGKEDPFLKIGEANAIGGKGNNKLVYSLRDINVSIEQGDTIGIIGKNGAGKSTLLKILSQVTAPTTGKIKVKGRIASLLEVGTGFHPELTGRENIYLNGAILGMRKKEITKKLDAIIDFSGIERHIDTPVKRYSSGMYVRLAFAVAAHLESEILIVDEVLAVGDAEFQKKCLGKMSDISKGEGRTVLFVSHNIAAVESLCKKGLLLDKGLLSHNGLVHDTILCYLSNNISSSTMSYNGNGIIKKAAILTEALAIKYNHGLKIEVVFKADETLKNIVLGIVITDMYDTAVVAINNRHYINTKLNETEVKEGVIIVDFPAFKLMPGAYKINLFLGDSTTDIEVLENVLAFTVEESSFTETAAPVDYRLNKLFMEDVKWNFKYI